METMGLYQFAKQQVLLNRSRFVSILIFLWTHVDVNSVSLMIVECALYHLTIMTTDLKEKVLILTKHKSDL